jgi:dephospho-CoA kinase
MAFPKPLGAVIKVGITGGIGSGKTTVCRIFEILGVPVYYADDRAKWLMENRSEVAEALRAAFGEKVFDATGRLDRGYLSSIAFSDPEKLAALNAIVHPAVFEDGFQWEMEQAEKGVPYCLKEAALLVESGSYRFLDKLIVVTAPEEVRIARVIARDGATEEAVRQRMARQLPEADKVALADFVVQNDGHLMLTGQVLFIHRQLLQQSRPR